MQPLNLHINGINNRNKNHDSWFLYAIYVVLSLFILQLLITPLTFSNWWHCPMMCNDSITMSMDMNICPHSTKIQNSKETKHNHHKKTPHGMVLCPLCTSFALPSTLTNSSELPAVSVIIIAYQVKASLSHAPPKLLIRNNPPRAPPLF